MGIAQGLKALNDTMEKVASSQTDRPKSEWVKLAPNETQEIRFLQEVDADSKFYSEKNGLVLAASEHTKPGDYRTKAVCSLDDEGRCYGCERHQADYKEGWKARTRLYANVLIGSGKDAQVAILSQGFSGKSITPNLLQAAEAFGGITKTIFSIKRIGSGTDTSYSLFPKGQDESFDPESYELFDLEQVAVRKVPYAEQSAFFNGGDAEVFESTQDLADTW